MAPEFRIGSMPKAKTATFLELQMLVSKKEFLEKQLADMEKRKKNIDKQLSHIASSMQQIEAEINNKSSDVKSKADKNKSFGVELSIVRY